MGLRSSVLPFFHYSIYFSVTYLPFGSTIITGDLKANERTVVSSCLSVRLISSTGYSATFNFFGPMCPTVLFWGPSLSCKSLSLVISNSYSVISTYVIIGYSVFYGEFRSDFLDMRDLFDWLPSAIVGLIVDIRPASENLTFRCVDLLVN